MNNWWSNNLMLISNSSLCQKYRSNSFLRSSIPSQKQLAISGMRTCNWSAIVKVYFVRNILYDIFVRYILSGKFCPIHIVRFILSEYILSGIYCQIYFVRVWFVRVRFVRYILSSIFCPAYFVRYILSGKFCPGTFCPVYFVRYVLSGYILSRYLFPRYFLFWYILSGHDL